MKRILALDGGGIRGVFTLQILARIEELFQKEQNNPKLVLADVFDLIAGTSTGAIIAAFLSWGLPVREIEKLYIDHSPTMFAKGRWTQQWKSKYKPEAIAKFFRDQFSDGGKPAL
ncbi:MAG TPA: patatin-like phospholipase family protein, partial [Candidatus Baltobacteraceae bacterium]|nr:patatin-like phospholipase family protein [Candidatus Baltobacteraceae bacterium]